jgi:hypothetical protein
MAPIGIGLPPMEKRAETRTTTEEGAKKEQK